MSERVLHPEVLAHVEAEAEVVREAVSGLSLATPLCAIGMTYVDGNPPVVQMAAALSEENRRAMFDEHGEQALWRLWCPADWPIQVDHLLGEVRSARTRRAGRARKLLKAEQVKDPLEFLHHQIARALGERPPDIPLTDDFLAFSTEHELSEDMHDQVRTYAPAAAVAAYERSGWLRFPDDFL